MINVKLLVEFIKGTIDENAKYGIATVKPSRATKKCKIKKLRVEYFLTDYAIFLVTPKSCSSCERADECADEFILQIIQKFNAHHNDSEQYFIF
jgi:hypothetical protein